MNKFDFNKDGFTIKEVPFETDMRKAMSINLNLKFILSEMKRLKINECNYQETLNMIHNCH